MAAVIVEDGSLVSGANSLVSEADYAAYASLLGVNLTGDPSSQLFTAMEFINSHERQLKGTLVSREQGVAYPRSDLFLQGWSWLNTEIPRQAILLQKTVALDINAGIDPYNPPEPTSKVVKRERIEGAIEVEYAVPEGGNKKLSKVSSSEAILNVLKNNNGLSLVRA